MHDRDATYRGKANTFSLTKDSVGNTLCPMKKLLGGSSSKTILVSVFAQRVEDGSNKLDVEFFPTRWNDVVELPLPMYASKIPDGECTQIFLHKSSFWRTVSLQGFF